MSRLEGIDEAITRWDVRAQKLERIVRDEAADTCRDALPAIRQQTPVDTGGTRQAWMVEQRTGGRPALSNPLRHAGFVAGGTLPDMATAEFRAAQRSRPPFTTRLQREVP